jgi:hypothetical protein
MRVFGSKPRSLRCRPACSSSKFSRLDLLVRGNADWRRKLSMWEKVASEKSEAFISVGAGREDASRVLLSYRQSLRRLDSRLARVPRFIRRIALRDEDVHEHGQNGPRDLHE